MDDMDLSQFKEVFISEAKEHLVSLNQALIELEKNPSNKDILNQIFRIAHTIKGMSATMGYEKITNLSHTMEDVLDKLRKKEIGVKSDVVNIIFQCFDTLEKLIEDVGKDVQSEIDISELLKKLVELTDKKETVSTEVEKKTPQTENQKTDSKPAEDKQKSDEPDSLAKKSQSSIRINTSYLDTMMNLVGEMVISKSQLEQIGAKHRIEELAEALQQFDRIAIELQEAVLKTRMVTLSHIFDRYPRMVRDLSLKLNKEIEFEIFGSDIEIDRMLLDKINEPLVHLLRNAIDHGIEPPEERTKANKSSKGKVILKASRERGYISIQVSDDGKGMDPEAIRKKAIEKSIITEETADVLSDKEIYLLICDPRLSTAKTISDISGRGVGMDVVKTILESINGNLGINSQKGIGSSFSINLPLTMAIITALMVKLDEETYAIPLNNISEIVPFDEKLIKSISGKEVIVLRDEVLPLVRLTKKLATSTGEIEDSKPNKGFILKVESGNKVLALLVDDFLGRKEVVIKTLAGITKKAKGFSGATIMGDGSVVLILDIASL